MSTALKSETLASITIFATGSTASLANNANALSSTQDPTQSAYGGTGSQPGYQRGRFGFSGTFASAPSANSAIQIFFRLPTDGTLTGTPGAYETDLGRSTTPVAHLGAVIRLDTTNTAQARVSEEVNIPNIPFELILVNAASGQGISSGWSLIFVPSTDLGA